MKNLKKVINPLFDLPTPPSISFMWNFGFFLGILIVFQIMTGIILSMNFIQSEMEAFSSMIHIMRDSNSGWVNRFIHSNIASLFFMSIFIHLARGIFFGSPNSKTNAWLSGCTIFVMSMATAFFGYVLPWGQMSYWGATVITNIISAIPYMGKNIVEWLWGNFSVSQPTLNRFFSIHFILPFLISVVILTHIAFLHMSGSSNPMGANENMDKIEFHNGFTNKDTIFSIFILFILLFMICINPGLFMDPENMNEANPMKAPVHIQPEWYFLFAYAILRSIPSKIGGILALILSILIFFILPMKKHKTNSMKFSPTSKFFFIMFCISFMILTFIGSKPVEDPYLNVGKMASFSYFIFMLL